MKNLYTPLCTLAVACTFVLISSTPATSATSNLATDLAVEFTEADSPWMDSRGELSDNVEQLATQIQDSVFHGLNPANYHLAKIAELNETLKSNDLSAKQRQKTLTKLEATLDSSFYKLADHLGSSLIEGRDVQDYIFRSSPKPKLNSLYDSVSDGALSIDEAFETIVPTHTDYVQLQHHLRNLMFERSEGLGRTAVKADKPILVGDTHPAVRDAKLRLIESGDFNGASGVNDTLNPAFSEAIISFQERHHISPSGDLDKATVAAMNRSVEDDITDVVVSLERWRWMPRELGFQRVIANVPDFRLRMYNGEQKIADMAVVVGKRKHRTPLFSETIKHVVAAPTWTVPASIANNELVPLERRNPGYLERNNYELLSWKGGKPVPVPFSRIPASAWDAGRFPYTIRQKAGDDVERLVTAVFDCTIQIASHH